MQADLLRLPAKLSQIARELNNELGLLPLIPLAPAEVVVPNILAECDYLTERDMANLTPAVQRSLTMLRVRPKLQFGKNRTHDEVLKEALLRGKCTKSKLRDVLAQEFNKSPYDFHQSVRIFPRRLRVRENLKVHVEPVPKQLRAYPTEKYYHIDPKDMYVAQQQ